MSFSARGLVSATAAVIAAVCTSPAATLAAPPEDAIDHLPGYGRPPTPMFSGYLDASDGCTAANGPECKLHYWLAMADDERYRGDPDHDADAPRPTVLWLNGGPGSSSLYGFLQELGPLLMNATGGLMANPWAWTKANVHLLVLESPMGVGFSYCSRMLDAGEPCINTDTTTAATSRAAMVDFFARKFPELQGGGFYIAGESYAGVYVPTLARELLTDEAALEHVPLRGVLVGDPCTDGAAQADSMDPLWYAHKYGLVDDEVFDALGSAECADYRSRATRHLTRTEAAPRTEHGRSRGTHSSKSRRSVGKRRSAGVAAAALNAELRAIEDLRERRARAEGLYRERVLGAVAEDAGDDAAREGGGEGTCRLAYRKFLLSSSRGLSQGWHDLYIDDYSLFAPVTTQEDEQMAAYLNREDVRRALHVAEAGRPWRMYPEKFSYVKEYNACNWQPDIRFPNTTMVDVYRRILPSLERVWIYNGDTDPCVSYEGTREAVKQILAPELDGGSYRPWFYRQEAAPLAVLADKAPLFGPDLLAVALDRPQFAGEVTSYAGGLAFATFHGSGHMVPQFRPQSGLHFLERFLYARGAAGEELAPLLPANATLAALSEDAFDAAMDDWTERAEAMADADHAVSSENLYANRLVGDCVDACVLESHASRERAPQSMDPAWPEGVLDTSIHHAETATSTNLSSNNNVRLPATPNNDGQRLEHRLKDVDNMRPRPDLDSLREEELSAYPRRDLGAEASFHGRHLHFLLVAGGVLLGMVISHLVAKRSAPRRLGAAPPSSSLGATEATPLRNVGV